MSHSDSGLYLPDNLVLPSQLVPHPLAGLPWDIVRRIITNPFTDLTGVKGIDSYFNHFMRWEGPVAEGAASGWLLSGTTGAATIALTNDRNGAIALTGDATANVNPTLGLGSASLGAGFGYVIGKRMWCFARLKLTVVATAELFFGLGTPDTSPTVTGTFPSDGIFFHKTLTGTKLNLDARKDGTSTSKTTIGSTLVDATYTTIGFVVDSLGNIIPYQDGIAVTAGVIPAGTANIPTATADVLGFMVGILGASQVLTLDWILLAQEN